MLLPTVKKLHLNKFIFYLDTKGDTGLSDSLYSTANMLGGAASLKSATETWLHEKIRKYLINKMIKIRWLIINEIDM